MKKNLLTLLLVFTGTIAAMASGHTVGVSSQTNVTCFGIADGTATASVNGGTGPFTYNWAPGGSTDATAFNLSAGTYTVTVTDQNDQSTASASVTIAEPTQLSISSNNLSQCQGDCSKQFTTTASGGTPAYNYIWQPATGLSSNSSDSPTVCVAATTTYTITITDANGCTAKTTAIVSDIPVPIVTIPNSTNCNGTTTTLTANGASAYDWSPATGLSSSTGSTVIASPTITTTYTVIGTNMGCTGSENVVVTPDPTPVVSVPAATICAGHSVVLTASGARDYTWAPATGLNTMSGKSVTCATITTTTYTVTGTNPSGCTGTTTVVVTVNGTLTTISGQTTVCNGSSATLTATGGGSYVWSTGETTTTITISPAITTNYTVTTSDAGCTGSATVKVIAIPDPIITISGRTTICSGDSTILSPSWGNTYSWAPFTGSSHMMGASLVAYPTTTTTYTVVATNGGCTGSASVAVTVNLLLTGVTITDSVYKETCLGTADGAIDITLSGSNSGPFVYEWNNGASTQDITNLISNNYSFTLWDVSKSNCISKKYKVIAEGTNCGSLSGNVFNDKNTDCVNNAGDADLSNIKITLSPGNRIAYTNNQGGYVFNNVPFGTYTLTQQINSPYAFPSCTTILNANLNVSNKKIANLNFADTLTSYLKDIAAYVYIGPIVPGFQGYVSVSIHNLTMVPTSGILSLILPTGYGPLVTSGTNGYSIIGDTIQWTYSNIANYYTTYQVYFTVPVNTTLGSIFKACALATVNGNDANLTNNYHCNQRVVTGSYDPNDKAVNPIGQGPQGNITLSDNTLDYRIRFQNTGNGPAVNIVVKDTLSDKLDISTLDLVHSSHNYILDVIEGNILRWKFNNIMLADSFSNEPASHGWISYRIKQNTSNQIGDQIKNTAHIYFDFNEAVVTNTTLNTIATPIGIKESESTNSVIKVYPNPFSDNTTFIIQSDKSTESYSFELLDVLGKQVKSIKEITTKEFQISRNGLPNGIYFYKVYSIKSVIGIGKLIVK